MVAVFFLWISRWLFCSPAVAWWVANTWKSRATIRGGEMLWRRISKFFCTVSYPEVKGEKKVFILHIKWNLKAISDENLARIMTFCSFNVFFSCFCLFLFFFNLLASSWRSQGFILSLVKSQDLFYEFNIWSYNMSITLEALENANSIHLWNMFWWLEVW